MKYLLAQPANIKFQWELDVVLTNIRSMDEATPIVLLFLEERPSVVEHFKGRYPNLEIHTYPDERVAKSYPPTIRPFLVWKYLSEDPSREQEDYFQIDSDIIFRELPDFSKMPLDGKICWASDCGGYIDYGYLVSRQKGPDIVKKFAEILNISEDVIKETPGGGAQWLFTKPTAQLWFHTLHDSQLIYNYLQPLDSDVQKWTAEMWAQLYNLRKFGWEVKLSSELDFCRPTDDVRMWEQTKILHNAGVVGVDAAGLFYKGKYQTDMPFGQDFSWVRRDKASIHYVNAINNVIQ